MKADMKQTEQWVWDISFDEARYLYEHRHMNNYVFAALSVYHSGTAPVNQCVKIRNSIIPSEYLEPIKQLVKLIEYFDTEDPTLLRIHSSYYIYRLLGLLKNISCINIDKITELFSVLAFIPILIEKKDGLMIWKRPVKRKKSTHMVRLFELLYTDISVHDFTEEALFNDEKEPNNSDPYFYISRFVTRGVGSVLGMIENGIPLKEGIKAFHYIETKMRSFEKAHGLSSSLELGKNRNSAQLRYRNTLYLYGGNTLERVGQYNDAFEWYTKDIYYTECTQHIGFYLTGLKTTERLLCAYRITPKHREKKLLRDLIDLFLIQSLKNSASYAKIILDFVDSKPDLDLSQERFFLENDRFMLFGGESTREPFLLSLLYHKIIHGIDYGDIDYKKYLIYDSGYL